jgi:hypothetical protein
MKSEVELHLPLDLHSPDQVSSVLVELQKYRGEQRDATVRAKAGGKAEKPEMSETLENLLRLSNVAHDNGPGLEALAKQLAGILKAAPVMHVLLAGPPNRTFKRQLTVWFRTQVHPTSLLTFAARADIGGGIILQAGSHMYDYSFRGAILDNKKRLMELAGGV